VLQVEARVRQEEDQTTFKEVPARTQKTPTPTPRAAASVTPAAAPSPPSPRPHVTPVAATSHHAPTSSIDTPLGTLSLERGFAPGVDLAQLVQHVASALRHRGGDVAMEVRVCVCMCVGVWLSCRATDREGCLASATAR
jgi:hypothetical protein